MRVIIALALNCLMFASAGWTAGLPANYSKARAAVRRSKAKPKAVSASSSLSLGRCALGPVDQCFDRLRLGLPPQDRPYVRLAGQDVFVDAAHRSDSSNFQALQKVAAEGKGRVLLEILSPRQSFSMLQSTTWPDTKMTVTKVPMGTPKTKTGFEGYTFFPYPGKSQDGVLYSPGRYTLVEVNTEPLPGDTVTESIHHELRHVLLGDFGRAAAKAKHGLPPVEQATAQAEKEAKRYESSAIVP